MPSRPELGGEVGLGGVAVALLMIPAETTAVAPASSGFDDVMDLGGVFHD